MEHNFVEFMFTHEESSISDCESGTSSFDEHSPARGNLRRVFNESAAVELAETARSSELIRWRFLAGVGDTAEVVAVHRRNWSENFLGQARVLSFWAHADALARKYNGVGGGGGTNNVRFCWYGGDKHRIRDILDRGFNFRDLQLSYGGAIVLSPDNAPSLSVEDSSEDEDGLRYVLLCRVLLGWSKLITPESSQCCPSSAEFESGVDSYNNPTKYIIWSTHMNTHILPEFVVIFKTKSPQSSSQGVCGTSENAAVKMPTSPWILFPALISVLARILPHDAIALINKFHKDYKERRINRAEMIQKVRQITGDKLLIAVVNVYKGRNKGKLFSTHDRYIHIM